MQLSIKNPQDYELVFENGFIGQLLSLTYHSNGVLDVSIKHTGYISLGKSTFISIAHKGMSLSVGIDSYAVTHSIYNPNSIDITLDISAKHHERLSRYLIEMSKGNTMLTYVSANAGDRVYFSDYKQSYTLAPGRVTFDGKILRVYTKHCLNTSKDTYDAVVRLELHDKSVHSVYDVYRAHAVGLDYNLEFDIPEHCQGLLMGYMKELIDITVNNSSWKEFIYNAPIWAVKKNASPYFEGATLTDWPSNKVIDEETGAMSYLNLTEKPITYTCKVEKIAPKVTDILAGADEFPFDEQSAPDWQTRAIHAMLNTLIDKQLLNDALDLPAKRTLVASWREIMQACEDGK